MRMRSRLFRTVQRFLGQTRAVAAVEFALILPVMLLVYLGSTEAGVLFTVDRKVQQVAGAVGDLVARTNLTLTQSQMEDYFQAASGIMTPYSANEVLQVVTAVAVGDDGTTEVLWSVEYQGGEYRDGTLHLEGNTFPLPQQMIDISLGQTVIAAEAMYEHRALFGLIFDEAITFYRSNFFLPRFGGSIDII